MKFTLICFLVALMGPTMIAGRFFTAGEPFDASTRVSFLARGDSTNQDGIAADTFTTVGGFGEATDGRVEVRGYGKSTSYAKAISEIKVVLVEVYEDADPTKDVKAEAKAKGSVAAEAFAGTYTEASVSIKSTGSDANGCATVRAEAGAVAEAFAGVIVTAVSGIQAKEGLEYVRVASQSYYAGLFAEAYSVSAARACAANGASASSLQRALSAAISTAFIEAFANAASYSYNGGKSGKTTGSAGGDYEVAEQEAARGDGRITVRTEDGGEGEGSVQGETGARGAYIGPCLEFPEYLPCCEPSSPSAPSPSPAPEKKPKTDTSGLECKTSKDEVYGFIKVTMKDNNYCSCP